MKKVIHKLFKAVLIICVSNVLFVNKLCAQVNSTSDWEEIAEQFVSDEEGEERSIENYVEELSDFHQHPFNLNTITKEQLENFPFLTDLQIEHLLAYIYIYGPMKTVYELQMVEDMDRQTIQYLCPFVYVGEVENKESLPKLKNILKYGKNELLTRFDIPFNQKKGYKAYPDSVLLENPNKKYLGYSFYHSLKYGFHYKDQIYIGLTAEKDAGEPFFVHENKKGYDFYSFYFLARNFRKLKALALGNYRLSYGLGLVISTDYSLGKTATISTIGYKTGGIRKHSSTDEYNFFRGIAGSYQINNVVISGFYSHRKLDAIVENELITSLKKDGMHRVYRDFEKRNKVVNQMFGGNITYTYSSFQLGLTGVHYFFNKMFIPEIKPYSVFRLKGRRFYNIGMNYRYRWNKFTLYGETAISQNNALATLNVVRFAPVSGYQILLLQRFYAKDYQAMYARSFSEGSGVENENGFFIGMEVKPIKYWKLFAYADCFHFPWLRYGIDKPSSGFDGLVQATYSPQRNLTMFLRYQYKSKDKNYRDDETNLKSVLTYSQHKLRYQLGYTLGKSLSFRTMLNLIRVTPQGMKSSNGFMLNQQVDYSFQQFPFTFGINYGFFDTDDYSSRITIYERGILYALSMPAFFGKGSRFACNLRYDINNQLTTLVKISRTEYSDREEIGSGFEQITGNKKTDLYMQLRWKF